MASSPEQTTTAGPGQLPAPGRWRIDPAHSEVQFVARHMMISKVRGRFREFSGTLDIAPAPEQSTVEVVIQASSIDTGDEQRDAHLRSAEFLDVAHHPEIRFRSTSVRPDGAQAVITGDITIRGITRPVTMNVEFCGTATDPWGNLRAGFLGSMEINREDFDITWNQALEAGGFLVGKGVRVELDVEAVRESEDAS